MRASSENIKSIRLKNLLANRIESGEFAFGSRFPGLHDLAKEYLLSYSTTCKAVKMLEHEGFLSCKPGIGYFVCYSDHKNAVPAKEVNIITYGNEDYPAGEVFEQGCKLFRDNGWKVNLLITEDLYTLTPQINSPDTFSIFTAFNVNWERFSANFGQIMHRVLVLGRLSGNPAITSIVADEVASIRLCMEHFAAMGKKKAALFTLLPDSELAALRIAAWRTVCRSYGLPTQWMRDHLLTLQPKESKSAVKANIETVSCWLAQHIHDTDALILPAPLGYVIDTLRQAGIAIPDRLAVVAISSKDTFLRSYPEVAVLDNNYIGHFQYALDILEDRFVNGNTMAGSWYFCQPLKIISNGNAYTKTTNNPGKGKTAE